MKNTNALFVLATLFAASSAFAADATISADNSNIVSACSADAQTAGCSGEVVGKGLLRCLHAYKKAHAKDFKFSPGCKTAMAQRHSDKAAGK